MFSKITQWTMTLVLLAAISSGSSCTKDSHNGKVKTQAQATVDSSADNAESNGSSTGKPEPDDSESNMETTEENQQEEPRISSSKPSSPDDAAQSYVPPDGLGAEEAKVVEKLTTGQNTFAVNLYKRAGEKKGNLFVSPFSISTALSMTYAGAHGETASQMHKTLHLGVKPNRVHAAFFALLERTKPPESNNTYQLNLANKIFIQQGYSLLPGFVKTLRKFYGSGAESVDFRDRSGAAKTINHWVEKQTNKKIKEIVQKSILGPLTRLVLTNAVYFKGNWHSLFKETNTRPRTFFLSTKNKIKADTMYQKTNFQYGSATECQILEMDYQGGDLSMVVVLPRKKTGLDTVEKKLSSSQIREWISSLRRRKVHVYLPKFKLKWGRSIKKDLIALGMAQPFSRATADFRRINGHSGNKGLFIEDVLHKAFVEVNEAGTEAAGATAAVLGVTGIAQPPKKTPVFRADHPFLFLIRHKKTGSILFMGRLADPR